MRVAVGCDFSAMELKDKVRDNLVTHGYEVLDVGQNEGDADLIYPEAAKRIAEAVCQGKAERGIVFCGTGGGVSIVANKFKGIYCVACESMFTAQKMRQLNGANVLAMGKNVVGEQNAYEIVSAFLHTGFCQDYSEERTAFVDGLRQRMLEIEKENMK